MIILELVSMVSSWYNYWAGENNYPEITIDDLIKFLKQEIEPKRIDYGEIEGIYYESSRICECFCASFMETL